MTVSAFAEPTLWYRGILRGGGSVYSSRHAFLGSGLPPTCSQRNQGRCPNRVIWTNRIGVPKVSGARKGSEKITKDASPQSAQPVISVPAESRPSILDNSVGWFRGNPVRGVAIGMFFAFLIARIVRIVRPRPQASENDRDRLKGTRKSSYAGGGQTKAVPLKHESTEEAMDLLGNTSRKYVIVGGKGGVGKTSMSAALATQFADQGQVTLIVSTDPAHSLSDAFDQSVSGGSPVPVVGIDNLYAQEVNPENVKKTFKLLSESGAGAGMLGGLDDMGFDDLNSLFETLPPGFDEAVALTEIVKFIEGDPEYRKYQRIVFDTAPTGHTLRLLALPDFLNGFFGKILAMKSKFGSAMNQLKGMFGGNRDVDSELDASMNDMQEMKRSMAVVRDLFRDAIQTEFIVATIPNMMAIAESRRLIDELRKEKIPIRHVFVNQIQPSNDDCTFCSARHKEHVANLQFIQSQFKDLRIATVQSFDREIRGAPALRTMGSQLFPSHKDSSNESSGDATSGTVRESPEVTSASSRPASAPIEIVE